jgi:hypothetical protein
MTGRTDEEGRKMAAKRHGKHKNGGTMRKGLPAVSNIAKPFRCLAEPTSGGRLAALS